MDASASNEDVLSNGSRAMPAQPASINTVKDQDTASLQSQHDGMVGASAFADTPKVTSKNMCSSDENPYTFLGAAEDSTDMTTVDSAVSTDAGPDTKKKKGKNKIKATEPEAVGDDMFPCLSQIQSVGSNKVGIRRSI